MAPNPQLELLKLEATGRSEEKERNGISISLSLTDRGRAAYLRALPQPALPSQSVPGLVKREECLGVTAAGGSMGYLRNSFLLAAGRDRRRAAWERQGENSYSVGK
jgi:hypothetical protein